MSNDTPTFDPSTELWPTPRANKVGGYSSPRFRQTLAQAVLAALPPQPSSPAASLASLSPLPGSDAARRMTVTSGRKCAALLKKSDPVGSWLRMCLDSSRWHSTKCYLTWKPSATPSGRLLFRLVPSMPRTKEREFGFWLTPSATDGKPITGGNLFQTKTGSVRHRRPDGRCSNRGLSQQVQLWPTPSSMQRGAHSGRKKVGNSTVSDTTGTRWGQTLQTAVGSGTLNPAWVEWLMGYPMMWTEPPL